MPTNEPKNSRTKPAVSGGLAEAALRLGVGPRKKPTRISVVRNFDPSVLSQISRDAIEDLLQLEEGWYVRGQVSVFMHGGRPFSTNWCTSILQAMVGAGWLNGSRRQVNGRVTNLVYVNPRHLARKLWCQ